MVSSLRSCPKSRMKYRADELGREDLRILQNSALTSDHGTDSSAATTASKIIPLTRCGSEMAWR